MSQAAPLARRSPLLSTMRRGSPATPPSSHQRDRAWRDHTLMFSSVRLVDLQVGDQQVEIIRDRNKALKVLGSGIAKLFDPPWVGRPVP